jgi:hypothetical protein
VPTASLPILRDFPHAVGALYVLEGAPSSLCVISQRSWATSSLAHTASGTANRRTIDEKSSEDRWIFMVLRTRGDSAGGFRCQANFQSNCRLDAALSDELLNHPVSVNGTEYRTSGLLFDFSNCPHEPFHLSSAIQQHRTLVRHETPMYFSSAARIWEYFRTNSLLGTGTTTSPVSSCRPCQQVHDRDLSEWSSNYLRTFVSNNSSYTPSRNPEKFGSRPVPETDRFSPLVRLHIACNSSIHSGEDTGNGTYQENCRANWRSR